MEYNICMLPGDGVGPEILKGAEAVLDAVGQKFDHKFNYNFGYIGGDAIDNTGVPFPDETRDLIDKSDAVLLGAVGGYKWDTIPNHLRPEKGLLAMRKHLEAFSNIRPVGVYKSLVDRSPLKSEIIGDGVDFCFVRELTGGIYFGERFTGEKDGIEYAYDKEEYNVVEIDRIARIAFETAKVRGQRVTSVDKMNVLDSSKLWRKTVEKVALEYKDIELNHMYVDNAAMQIIKNPRQFDVILTNNIFGDILSDEASVIGGSIGLLPSASIGSEGAGLYEPIHGSAPDIAGKGIANPIGMIRSAAMMLKYSFDLMEEADAIETAIEKTLEEKVYTCDLALEGEKSYRTDDVIRKIVELL